MSKFIYKIFSIVALSLISCSDDPDIVDGSVGAGTPITLTARVVETKAAELESADFKSFKLYSYYSDASYYFDTTVTRDPSDNSCSFGDDTSHIWPEDGGTLTFYGYYPYEDLSISDGCIEYTSPYDAGAQQDLVVASKTTSADNYVILEFAHALSKINFTLTLDTIEANIQNVVLYYSYKQLDQTAMYDFENEEWKEVDGTDLYSEEFSFDSYNPSDDEPNTYTYEESLFVIPQTVAYDEDNANYLSVRVEYDLYNNNIKNHTVTTGNLALVNSDITSGLATEWKMGEEYTYNLTIDTANEISFTLDVDEREDTLAQGNIDLQYITDYYDVTDRIAMLFGDVNDGDLDLVIAGEYSSGILGYGSISCPFIKGFGDEYVITYAVEADPDVATHVYNASSDKYTYAEEGEIPTHVIATKDYQYGSADPDRLFSVDFRLMTNLPTFTEMHNGEPDNSGGDENTYIDGSDPSFPQFIFQYAERLEEVILPESVIAIGDYAFQGCSKLNKINMFGAKHVESCAFQACTNLTEVITTTSSSTNITGTLTRIHNNGFDNCSSLTTIDLSNVREIDQYGFVNCSSLCEVNLGQVTIVGQHAFNGCSSMYITTGTKIPNLETISDYAFAKCAMLGANTDIVINEAKIIGDHAFNGCTNLRLGNSYTEYDLYKVDSIGKYAFQECVEIDNLDISNVIKVKDYALYGCTKLKLSQNFTYSNLTHIGDSAFQACANLCANGKLIITPSKIDILGSKAFYDCIDFDFDGTNPLDFSELKSIENGIFGNCKTLDNPLTFSNSSVTSIGYDSFKNCSLLPSVTITPENITSIGSNAFYNCTSISAFEFDPSAIIDLGEGAFNGCSIMEFNNNSELLFSKLTTVNYNTFNGCTAMSNSLVFSDNLTTIGSYAFAGSGITAISGLDKVTSVGSYAFQGCDDLTTIPLKSVTSIGASAFESCSSLATIDLSGISSIGTSVFKSCSSLATVDLSGISSIGTSAFESCSSLTDVVDTHDIETLSELSFARCTSLKSIDMSNVTTLGYRVFYNCKSLEKLELPKFEGALDMTKLFGAPAYADDVIPSSEFALTELSLPLVTSVSNLSTYLSDAPYLTTLNLPCVTTVSLGDIKNLTYLYIPGVTSTSYGSLCNLTSLEYLDLSNYDLAIDFDSNPFGSLSDDPNFDGKCTLVLNEKYKTAHNPDDNEDYYVCVSATPNEDETYTNVSWMNITWKEIKFVSE